MAGSTQDTSILLPKYGLEACDLSGSWYCSDAMAFASLAELIMMIVMVTDSLLLDGFQYY